MDSFFSRLALSDERPYRIGRHTVFWVACWLFMGFIYGFYYTDQPKFYVSYVESFIYLPQHIFLAYTIIYYVLPSFILKEKYWYGIVMVILMIIGAALFSPLILYNIVNPFRKWAGLPTRNYEILYSFMAGLRGSMTVAGFAVAIKLIKYWYLKKIENEQLEKEKLKGELEILKGQLHPHFMFNTLNSIYALSLKKSDRTSDSILKLAHLMRYMLTECSLPLVELRKEVDVLQYYTELEKGRFDQRLDMTININGDLEKNKIAPLLLLPFLENSFKHGANEMIEQAWISLDLSVENKILKFKLINGRAAPKENDPNSAHIGLQNVKKRLDLLYPDAHELRITEDEDTFVVSLMVKLDQIRPVEL